MTNTPHDYGSITEQTHCTTALENLPVVDINIRAQFIKNLDEIKVED
jgi:hypothetical protein